MELTRSNAAQQILRMPTSDRPGCRIRHAVPISKAFCNASRVTKRLNGRDDEEVDSRSPLGSAMCDFGTSRHCFPASMSSTDSLVVVQVSCGAPASALEEKTMIVLILMRQKHMAIDALLLLPRGMTSLRYGQGPDTDRIMQDETHWVKLKSTPMVDSL